MDEEISIKLILLGNSGTGKTNIINSFINKPFDDNACSTITSAFATKSVIINQKNYNVDIWDTAGQEAYRSLTKIFINDSNIVIFVYDITNKNSFTDLEYWINLTKEILDDSTFYVILGNKYDLYLNEQVEEEEARKKAEEIGAYFKLSSAKCERKDLNKIFDEIVEKYVNKMKIKNNNNDEKDDNLKEEEKIFDLNKNNKNGNTNKKKCC